VIGAKRGCSVPKKQMMPGQGAGIKSPASSASPEPRKPITHHQASCIRTKPSADSSAEVGHLGHDNPSVSTCCMSIYSMLEHLL
jgi:hypothetical protein